MSHILKTTIQSFSKILVFSFVLALITGFLNPLSAKAEVISTPQVDATPVNLTVTKSHAFVGDSSTPTITVNRKTGATFPSIPSEDYYYAHLYNLDTGDFVSSEEITSSETVTLNFPNFIPEGVNTYQVLLSHEVYLNPDPIMDIEDFENPIGKSEAFVYERKPLTLSLETPDPLFRFLGADLSYKLNQEINGDDYTVYIFNITTGDYEYDSTSKEDYISRIRFPFGDANLYKATLTKKIILPDEKQPKFQETIVDSVISSNIIAVERDSWSVEIYESSETPGNMGIQTLEGGGEYATYLVQNSTGIIVWDELDPTDDPETDISNSGIGYTAYVARAWKERYSDTILSEQPTTFNDIKDDIIADSSGWYAPTSGITDSNQIAGGKNPDENCTTACHGDPINTATGEFFDHEIDIETVGTGLTPAVERSFSTINKDKLNLLGYGWRTNYEMKVVSDSSKENFDPNILTSNFLLLENENSSVSAFYRSPSGSFVGSSKTMANLTFDTATQTFIFVRDNKEIYTFSSTGKLVKIQNDRNQTLTLTYQNSKLQAVTDLAGNTLSFAYNANNLLSAITAQNGRVTTYTYNTAKLLTKVVNSKNITYNYTYDTARRVKTLTNELGGVTTNTYNTSHQVTKQVDPLGRIMTFVYSGDITDGTTQIKYPNTKVIEETYKRGQLVKKVENYGKAGALTRTYAYNSANRLVGVLNHDLSSSIMIYDRKGNMLRSYDGKGNLTSFTYDGHDNLLTATDPLENITTNVYDTNDNLLSTTTPLGEKTSFTYNADKSLATTTDARGNALTADPSEYTSAFTYLSNGLVSGITNALNGSTSMNYNNVGDMTETEDARGNKTKIENNALGLPTKVTDPLQNETAMTYDQMGNTLTSANAKGYVTTYTYDAVGNILTTKNALNETTTYTYSPMNQPVTITLADGTIQTITYDIFGRVTELKDQLLRVTKQEWDSNHRLTASINPDGGRTQYTYDTAGNVKTVKTPKGAVTKYEYDKLNRPVKSTDALGRSSMTEYDANGQVIKTTDTDGTTEQQLYDALGNIVETKDEEGNSKLYTYDALNRKISATNELGQATTYSYDAASNLVSQVRPDSSVVGYIYDVRNLLTSIDYPGTTEDITYTYDELGRKLTEKKGTSPTVNYAYDALNRVSSRGDVNNLVGYSYDNVGNLLALTYPSGRIVNYDYDDAAQLTQLTTAEVGTNSFGYNARGLLSASTLANGIIESQTYDADSQLLSTELLKGITPLYKRTQSYNMVGDVTQRGTASNGAALTLENFTYDPVSRLTEHKADATGQSLNSYNYNPVGNLTTVGDRSQTYDVAGKVTVTDTADFAYDARNNRTALIDSVDIANNVEYEWSQNNLLETVIVHDGATPETVSYAYSADSLLKTRAIGTTTDEFVWDTSRQIPAMLSDGKYEYVYSQDRVPLAQIEILTGVVTYLHSDLTGSVTASTDASGQLEGTIDYSPYGVPTGSPLSGFGYAGEWVDGVTGYSYLKARWLDTLTGTFLSEDPLVQQTNNAFGYTEGNPITQIDPLGLMTSNLIITNPNPVLNNPLEAIQSVFWLRQNAGYISALFGLAAVISASTIVGAPAAPVLGAIGTVFGWVGLEYEIGNCVGYTSDKACDPGAVTLSAIGVATGGVGLIGGKLGISANSLMNLNNSSVVSGVIGSAMGLAVSIFSSLTNSVPTENEKEEC